MKLIVLSLFAIGLAPPVQAEDSNRVEARYVEKRIQEELKATDREYDELSLKILNHSTDITAKYGKAKWDQCENSKERKFRSKPPCFDILTRSNHIDSLKRKQEEILTKKNALRELDNRPWGKRTLDQEVDDYAASYENLRRRHKDNFHDVLGKSILITKAKSEGDKAEQERLEKDMRNIQLERRALEKNMNVILQQRLILSRIQLEYVRSVIAENAEKDSSLKEPFAGTATGGRTSVKTVNDQELMEPFKKSESGSASP